jgi:hypothetical protein
MVIEAEDYLSEIDEIIFREYIDGLSEPRECPSGGVLTGKELLKRQLHSDCIVRREKHARNRDGKVSRPNQFVAFWSIGEGRAAVRQGTVGPPYCRYVRICGVQIDQRVAGSRRNSA